MKKIFDHILSEETKKFPSDIRLDTTSCIKYGGHCFPEHNRKGWGTIGYEDAFRVSSNTFFYQIGVDVGIRELHATALQLGFNTRTGIELANEESTQITTKGKRAF